MKQLTKKLSENYQPVLFARFFFNLITLICIMLRLCHQSFCHFFHWFKENSEKWARMYFVSMPRRKDKWSLPELLNFCLNVIERIILSGPSEFIGMLGLAPTNFWFTKEYLPNLLVSTFWGQIFVFWVRDLKFWLLAYFLILLSCAKFQ